MIEFVQGFGLLIGYYLICASAALLFRLFIRVHSEISRKLLHIIVLFSLLVWPYAFNTWWIASLAALFFIVLVFPLLSLAEKLKRYAYLLTERKKGEVKHSLILAFCMFAAINSICWGWLGKRWLVLACICAWGFGDAAAALVGKKFGRHYLTGRLIEGRKSIEGTLAMFIVSLISVFIVIFINTNISSYISLAIAFITAAASSAVELYTRSGMDTFTCPFAAAAVLLPLLYLAGAML